MRYVSTRGEAPSLDFVDVMLAGLARDGGLYVPERWPSLDRAAIEGFAGKPYAEVAVEVLRPFVGDGIAETDLARMSREAYGNFRHPAVAPLTQLDPGVFVLELFHGPTLAFKDLAMQLLARLMDHVLHQRNERTTIVVATSGDTGGAAIEAFRGRAQVDVIVLYPNGRISDVQRRMMTTVPDTNVHAVAIEGTFDDCQALVKAMFNHHAFRDRVRLSGVNSINWARIVAQAVYYFTAAVALGAPHRKIAFTVPTGNFGDVYAGYVASRMGLPIDRLVVATNINDILTRTFSTGTYEIRDVVATTSPSMDIQVSSNFERLLFDAYGRDANAVRALDGLARARAPLCGLGACAEGAAGALHRRPCRRAGKRRRNPHLGARGRLLRRSSYRNCVGSGRKRNAGSVRANGRSIDCTPREISRCGQGGLRPRSRVARLACRSAKTKRARHGTAGGSGGGRTICSVRLACGA